jgi:predicted dehydrogenase
VRLIQVGLGSWGKSWSRVVCNTEGVEFAAVVDPVSEACRWATEVLRLGPGDCYVSLDEALQNAECEAVLVTTPPETHHSVVTEALESGKHVLVEKPLATTLPDARALIDAANRADRTLMVSQNYRFTRPARAVRSLVTEGVLGALIACKVACRRDTRSRWPPDNFRYRIRHPYLQDMAIHHFDLLRAVTGQNVRRIYGRSWRVPDSPYRHDPAVVAAMELEGGASAVYEGNWATHAPETSWTGDWELVGEAGRIIWKGDKRDRNSGQVILEIWGQSPRLVQQPQLFGLERTATLQALRAAVENGKPPETEAADNIHSLAAVMGCIRSVESGTVVDIGHLLDLEGTPDGPGVAL